MASLVRDSRSRSPYWIACYTSADGRRLKKSTKQTARHKALEIALALERAEQLAAKSTLTETRARELIGEILERTTGDTVQFYTIEAWLRDWLKGKEVAKSKGTHVKYTHTVDSFLECLGKRSKLNIAAITPKDVLNFRDSQIASGKHPNTVRYLMKQLRIPFNLARRQGIITHNPAEAVELPPVAKGENGEETSREVFTIQQVKALLDASILKDKRGNLIFEAGQDWKGAILFAYYTGARLQDVANITWGAVDLRNLMITYRAKKTGKLVVIPLHSELESQLQALSSQRNNKAFIFPMLAGRCTGGRSGLSMAFSRIMTRADIASGVIHEKTKGGKGRTVRALTFHSLRHSFNSAMANTGIAQEIRMKLTGHSSAEMNKAYTHLELEPLRKAVDMLPSIAAIKK